VKYIDKTGCINIHKTADRFEDNYNTVIGSPGSGFYRRGLLMQLSLVGAEKCILMSE